MFYFLTDKNNLKKRIAQLILNVKRIEVHQYIIIFVNKPMFFNYLKIEICMNTTNICNRYLTRIGLNISTVWGYCSLLKLNNNNSNK